jgi:parallel beta-helix repeat protein
MQIACVPAFSATYYFSSTGSDSRTAAQAQDSSTPWQSINKLDSLTLAPGDSALLKRGDVFRGGIVVKQSGTATQRITIGAYGTGGVPVVTGGVAIDGWTTYAGLIRVAGYSGDPTKPVEQVFSSGNPLALARFPDTGYLAVDSVISASSFISAGLKGSTDWTGASVHIKTERWSLDWRVIASFDKTTGKVVLDRNANYVPQKGWGFFVNNSLAALSRPGEWYYDSTGRKLYVWMPDGSTPSGIEGTVVPYGVDAQSRSFLTIENLKFSRFAASGVRCGGTGIILRNCAIEYAEGNGIDAAISDSRLENCSVRFANQTGIEFNGSNNTIASDTILKVAMIDNLNRKGLGGNCCTGRGLDFSGSGNTVRFCVLDSIGYIGIGFGGQNSLIENNVVSHVCMTTDDGGAIYTWNDDFAKPGSAGSIIRKNIVADGVGAPQGSASADGWVHGIYMDDRTHDLRIDSNTCINNVLGIFLHNNRNDTAQGNVCYGNRGSQIQIQRDAIVSDNVYGNRVTGNVFFSTADTQNTILEEQYAANDSVLATLNNNYTCVENPFGVECRRDNAILWKQSYIDAQGLRVGANKIRNGNFDSSSLAWGGWPGQYIALSADSTKSADKRCLKIRYFGDPAQGTPIVQANGSYPLVKGRLYQLNFCAIENHAGAILAIARQSNSPYATVGISRQVALDTAWHSYAMFFFCTMSDSACRVDFQVSKADSLIWLDSVSLYEINGNGLNLQLRSRCFWNATGATQVFGLGSDTWRDVPGLRGIRGSLTVPSFLSEVLVRDSIGVVNRVIEAPFGRKENSAMEVHHLNAGIVRIDFSVRANESVRIEVFDMRGLLRYSSGPMQIMAGRHTKYIGPKNGLNSAGAYIVVLRGGETKTACKFIMLQ